MRATLRAAAAGLLEAALAEPVLVASLLLPPELVRETVGVDSDEEDVVVDAPLVPLPHWASRTELQLNWSSASSLVALMH